MPNNQLHIIFGAGPVGSLTVCSLRDRGLPVRAGNRSGHRPPLMPDDVEMRAADPSLGNQAQEVMVGRAGRGIHATHPRSHENEDRLGDGAIPAGVIALRLARSVQYRN